MITAADIERDGIVAVVRGAFSVAGYLRVGEALLAGGIRLIELTLDGPAALTAMPALRERFGSSLIVGAGTVRNPEDARRAFAAGAAFLVSPGLDEATVRLAQSHGWLHLPGVLTPTEAARALALGCTMVKLFPAEPLGPRYLNALRGPLPELRYVPTGGLASRHVAGYLAAGASALGFGSTLVQGPDQDTGEITANAREVAEAVRDAKAARIQGGSTGAPPSAT
jgi:2-dehydro-3-deoxyphosphogluconate aldolase / (4S)-4-hydroxy-2-oxoglutarate aldolase